MTRSLIKSDRSCPYCKAKNIYTYRHARKYRNERSIRYRCSKCRKDFTDKTGTVFHYRKGNKDTLDLVEKLTLKYELRSREVERIFRLNHKTAQQLVRKIRKVEPKQYKK